MSITGTKEFFINMKSIPTKDSKEYDAFFEEEAKKIEYGVKINGVYIHGWLYWHLNHWNISIHDEDSKDLSIKRLFGRPHARDNEWIIQEALIQAQAERKGIMLFGVRRFGKTEFEASYVGRGATIFKNSQNLVTGGSWNDIDLITSPLINGLDNLHPYFVAGRIAENPRKDIILGYKDKKGKRFPFSKILMRNYDNGHDTEAAAGTTPSTFVIDECGKFNFGKCLSAAIPSFTSPFGWACIPILTGTSGYIQSGSDAERYFNNPEANNFIMRELKEEGDKKVSIFISGLRRMEGKIKTTFGEFVKTEKGILVPKDSELNDITFYNSDFTKAEKLIDEERLKASSDPDPSVLLKATMYYPKNTKELFLTDDGNKFPREALIEWIDYLLANPELQGRPAYVYPGVDTKVRLSFNTDKYPILDYPIREGTSKDACIMIYEPPEENPPAYLYIAGADPYNQSNSKWSASLGSVYIYKRMYDPINGIFQRRIVASYTARPATLKEWHENVEMLLELYNAVCMPENEAGTFTQYFDQKNKSYMLADGYNFLKEIAPNTSITGRVKGLPATPKVKDYYKEFVYQYLTEKIQVNTDDKGEPIFKLGLTRIPDISLLRELVAFNDDGNFDRYVAFGHTLAHEFWADKIYPFVYTTPQKEDNKQTSPLVKINSPFEMTKHSNPFGQKSTNPFGVSPRRK